MQSKMLSSVEMVAAMSTDSFESCGYCREGTSETETKTPSSTSICIPVTHISFQKGFTARLQSGDRKRLYQMSCCSLGWKWLRCGGSLLCFLRGVARAFPMQKKRQV